jgi:L-alanine-DL-glutamate epimerase-like enolase superfamily enzyme
MHIEIAEALREAFPDMTLMLDPAGVDYSMAQAVRVGRRLEALDFRWLEEPFYDRFFDKYTTLVATLDIPIAASEATSHGPAGVAQFIRANACDIVRPMSPGSGELPGRRRYSISQRRSASIANCTRA